MEINPAPVCIIKKCAEPTVGRVDDGTKRADFCLEHVVLTLDLYRPRPEVVVTHAWNGWTVEKLIEEGEAFTHNKKVLREVISDD